MPYITQERRKDIEKGQLPATVGELNYKIMTIINMFVCRYGESYTLYNRIIGCLECLKCQGEDCESPVVYDEILYEIKQVLSGYQFQNHIERKGVIGCVELEIYRRMVSKYEDEKIKQNGDLGWLK
jgi:alpha-tubulin suppressor-like RCC1 family protein